MGVMDSIEIGEARRFTLSLPSSKSGVLMRDLYVSVGIDTRSNLIEGYPREPGLTHDAVQPELRQFLEDHAATLLHGRFVLI